MPSLKFLLAAALLQSAAAAAGTFQPTFARRRCGVAIAVGWSVFLRDPHSSDILHIACDSQERYPCSVAPPEVSALSVPIKMLLTELRMCRQKV